MQENGEQMKRKPNRKLDRFSSFIFGHREAVNNDDNHSQEFPEHKDDSSFESRSVDDWFFGSRRKEPAPQNYTTQNQIENYLNNIDLALLMETIDMFVTTTKQYKPLFNEITPFLKKFSKKFKSSK
ncbi:hypothetical protein [Neobacillus sp. PS2-9]|uniref:hypothetical protein n=1 Tax=Neobacillus sp. PS2-9 TaxID=3070676 RepID=UPI0027E1A50F|nr:hypothetical protein [Neobacillus sp. PS2-9]WML58899.1 hypothetical protein RCG25_03615 [Neobacillus sp. PS2-9]